jgi:hypothetical protein
MSSYRSSFAPNTDRNVPSDAWYLAHTYLPPGIMPGWTHRTFVDDNKTGEISITPMDRDGCYRTSGRYTDASGGVGGWTAHAYPYDQIDHYYTDAERNTYAAWTTENDHVVSVEGNPIETHEFDEQQLL